ncbi:hypothetical protein K458DRAFT_58217 [Lentithecium fluviatile CBS 122367]|uniref:Uncharacterized protein n=1 Tax=Lentithecium fluviatile CBS 122367 TaxID=1168545 RepID=A0A6G1IVY6_9PLEO|nr:hypothetical protein K458DRAFT_58217 [Lentithecium fluviatile CBS 122367]
MYAVDDLEQASGAHKRAFVCCVANQRRKLARRCSRLPGITLLIPCLPFCIPPTALRVVVCPFMLATSARASETLYVLDQFSICSGADVYPITIFTVPRNTEKASACAPAIPATSPSAAGESAHSLTFTVSERRRSNLTCIVQNSRAQSHHKSRYSRR